MRAECLLLIVKLQLWGVWSLKTYWAANPVVQKSEKKKKIKPEFQMSVCEFVCKSEKHNDVSDFPGTEQKEVNMFIRLVAVLMYLAHNNAYVRKSLR